LAGEACCPNISFRDVCFIEFPYIVMNWQVRPVLRQNFPAKGLDLTVKVDLETSPL
jgi:hypothetical protein